MRLLRYLLPLLLATSAQAAGSLISTAFQGFQTPTTVDLFNRANGGLGANWTNTFSNVLQIVGDTVQQSATNAAGRAIYSTGIYSSNQYAQVQIVSQATAGCVNGVHVLFTSSGGGSDTYYGLSTASAAGSSATLKLSKAIGGTATTLATYTVNLALGDSIGVSAVNGIVTGYHNGKALGSVADTSVTIGNPGIEVDIPSGGLVTDCSLDNFVAGNVNVNPTGQTLLAYLKSLVGSKILSGQTGDPYSGTPFDVFSGTAPNWFISGTTPNVATSIYDPFIQGPNNGGSPTMQNLTGSNSFVNTSNAWVGAGGILYVVTDMVNPANANAGSSAAVGNAAGSPCSSASTGWLYNSDCAWSGSFSGNTTTATFIGPFTASSSGTQWNTIASGNPWPNVVTNNGNSTYAAWQANVDAISAQLAQISGPFLYNPYGEISWTFSGTEWFANPTPTSTVPSCGNCSSSGSPSNWVLLWQQTYNRMMVTGPYASLLSKKMLWVWDISGANGGDIASIISGFWPGSAYVDVIGVDADQCIASGCANSIFTSMQQTFAGLAASSSTNTYPIFMGSNWATGAGSTGNYNTDVCSVLVASFPNVFGYTAFGQSPLLSGNAGAQACVVTSPFLNIKSNPVFRGNK